MDSKDADDQPSQPSDSGLATLGSTIASVQSSFANVYTTLHTTLEQSMQMTQTMNSMLVHMFKANVKIATRLEHKEGTLLTVTVTNATQFPVLDIEASLAFEKADEDVIGGRDATLGTPAGVSWSFQHAARARLGTDAEEPAPGMLDNQPWTLAPLTRHMEVQRISTDHPIQCNGKVTLRFAHPGGGEPIEIEHSFGLYLIDQLSKQESPTNGPNETGIERCYEASFFRDIMAIPPITGITCGTGIQLWHGGASKKQSETTVICRVVDILECGKDVRVRFHGAGDGGASLVDRLVTELDTLAHA